MTCRNGVSFVRGRARTLKTKCIIICRPVLPGYFPAMFEADRLKRLAPVSVQMAWTSIFFPTPEGPANSSDFTKGALSCTSADPGKDGEASAVEYAKKTRGLYARVLHCVKESVTMVNTWKSSQAQGSPSASMGSGAPGVLQASFSSLGPAFFPQRSFL